MQKKILNLFKFLTEDIWRVTENEVTKRKFSLYNIIKTFYISIKRFNEDRIASMASALTYSTLLAIVPMLAILFAIARGFGFGNILEAQIYNNFGGKNETTLAMLQFVDSYLNQAKGGVFIGIGLVMLLWTVLTLINNIETTFNNIWQVKKSRSIYRKITDYFSVFLLLPILIVVSSGVTIFVNGFLAGMEKFVLLSSISKFLILLIPYAITWLMFAGLYSFMPNTKVKFKHALMSGILMGSIYQAFQLLYISGQIWVSKYNTIYGNFAALPLFLLWLQASWTICLFGAQLTYTSQNIRLYSFDKDTKSVSTQYKDFIAVVIMSLIAKRFCYEKQEKPYTADELSAKYKIPIRLVNSTLLQLQKTNLLCETVADSKTESIAYTPCCDISNLSLAAFISTLRHEGSNVEEFKVDYEGEFQTQWDALNNLCKGTYNTPEGELLIKDL